MTAINLNETIVSRRNMIFIPGGTFLMGSDKFYPEEKPVHEVAEFREFVEAPNT